jgi:elongation factor 2
MEMAVSPILRHSIKPKNKSDLAKLVTELQRVVDADSTALLYKDMETGELILAGAGELHIEILISSLRQACGIEVSLSEPIIAYRESIRAACSDPILAKSDNKHNRVYFKASHLSSTIVEAMSSGGLVGLDAKAFGRELSKTFGWTSTEGARIWAIGPDPLGAANDDSFDRPTCILVDSTFGLQIPQDFKENITLAFKQLVRKGVLVGCPMRGVRFDLVDAKFHADAVHRRTHSVVPAAMRAMTGAFLSSDPTLVEPMYHAKISGSAGKLNAAFSVIGQRSGKIIDAFSIETMESVVALVPLRRSSGIGDELHRVTQGHAHCACTYSGMQPVPESEEEEIICATRKAKGLSREVPTAEAFIDKL